MKHEALIKEIEDKIEDTALSTEPDVNENGTMNVVQNVAVSNTVKNIELEVPEMGNVPVYEGGEMFYFWNKDRDHPNYVEPKWDNLREELIQNGSRSALKMKNLEQSWDILKKRVDKLMKKQVTRSLKSNGKYGIPKGQRIDEEHLMALLIHTDLTEVDKEYTKILREGHRDEVSCIAHWARLLMETVQCFGTKLESNQKYYRGVSTAYMFKNMTMRFNLPMSTSVSVCIIMMIELLQYTGT